MKKLFTILFLVLWGLSFAQTTLDQQLSVVRNDGIVGGQFNLAVKRCSIEKKLAYIKNIYD